MNWDIALDKDRKFFRWQNMVITARLHNCTSIAPKLLGLGMGIMGYAVSMGNNAMFASEYSL